MDGDYEPVTSIPTQWAFSFLYFLAIILGIELGNKTPTTALSLSIGLIAAGLPTLLYGIIKSKQHKNVYDYEPTVFRKKASNGKKIRTFLMTCSWIGLYCLVVGVVLFIKFHSV